MKRVTTSTIVFVFMSASIMLFACGGSDSGTTQNSPQTVALSGSVFAAPVSGATVTIKDINGNVIAGPAQTSSDGSYSVSIPASALSNTLIITSYGGTFTDEASSATTTAGTLAAYVPAGSFTSTAASVNLDPASTIIHNIVTSGSGTSVASAQSAFNSAFGFVPDVTIAPRNAPYSASTNTAQRLASLRAAAFSQMAKDLSLNPADQFNMFSAIAQDLADDGILNGSSGTINGASIPADMQNRFERGIVTMMTNTTTNLTGLTADQLGTLPFAKVALTNTYRVEYMPEMMPAAQGKTTFKLKITKRSDNSQATGLTISLMPKMYMSTMSHMTPVDSVIDNGDGTYTCTIYYLMSSMMNGMSMGFWELKVTIGGMGGETVFFYPNVGMAMGSDTVRATLKGQADQIQGMMGTEKRSYYLFRDKLISGTTTTFDLFIAAKESMMSYPPVYAGSTLHNENGTAWTVTTMSVEASTGSSTWVSGTDKGNGHWSISGITGLVSGQTGTVYVKLTVNGEQKTTDGNAPSGSNDYATFTVTP